MPSACDHHDPHDAVEQQDDCQGSAPYGPPSHGYAPPSAHAAIVRLGGVAVNDTALARLVAAPLYNGYRWQVWKGGDVAEPIVTAPC